MPIRRLASAIIVALTTLLPACSASASVSGSIAPHPPIAPLANGEPGSFIAWYNHGAGDVNGGSADELSEFSTRTGKVIGNLVDLDTVAKGMQLEGLDRGPGGLLWLLMESGPDYPGDGTAGPPTADSCRGEVLRIDPVSGRTTLVWRVPRTTAASNLTLSPNGRLLAIDGSGCGTSQADDITVVNVHNERSWTLGSGLPPCASLRFATWAAESRRLIATYTPATGVTFSQGECQYSRPFPKSRWRSISAAQATPRTGVPFETPPDPGWTANGVVALHREVVAVETNDRGTGCRARPFRPGGGWVGSGASVAGSCRGGIAIDADPSDTAALLTIGDSSRALVMQYVHGNKVSVIGRYVVPKMFLTITAW